MEFRTKISIQPSHDKITYDDRVMFIGSCFASSIGNQFEAGHLPVMVNPAGTVYNPVSVCTTLDTITTGKNFDRDDLGFHNGTWFSFFHYTDFSSEDPINVIEKINKKSKEARDFLENSGFLFITLGTARVYRLKRSGIIVSNCHKMPPDNFESEILTVSDIVALWTHQLDRLHSLFPRLKVVFTISPVRHWKDGAHGNQVSKSVLFLAVEELLQHKVKPQYFPAYELLMDDLRDYRFYADDMLHPSSSAINYIWEEFAGCYFDNNTINAWKEVVRITKAVGHRINSASQTKRKFFADRILKQISEIKLKLPTIDLSKEEDYFLKMRKSEN